MATLDTPAPTAPISPVISWPMMRGNLACRRPALMCWIVKPDPQVMTRATASPGPAAGSGTVTISNGVLGPRNTIAFMNGAPFACAPCHVISIDGHWQDSWKRERDNDQCSHDRPGSLGPDHPQFHPGQ